MTKDTFLRELKGWVDEYLVELEDYAGKEDTKLWAEHLRDFLQYVQVGLTVEEGLKFAREEGK